ATSSLAQPICHALAERGFGLTLVARDEVELDLLSRDIATRHEVACTKISADFLDSGFSAEGLVEKCGRFTHLIMVAGDMGHADPTGVANLAFTMHLNYTVPEQVCQAAAKALSVRAGEDKKTYHIAIIASVAGDRGRQSNYAYGAAKAALATFASGLRNRYFKQGVAVLTVKPGFIDTPMTWGMQSPLIASREAVAESIVKAMLKGKDVVYVPFFWRYIMLIILHIPEKVFKRLSL
ncbi:MAG: SDR family NAD(P)-dependent oxidoreductase, partial [Rickettsiales bacterium]|nr:SDR family NAD(P)-dependent oxidoreductase [Rickettsiales bacterium]